MTEQREYRYTPPETSRPCPDHPGCLVLRCPRWLCERTFHSRSTSAASPAASAARPAALPNTADSACDHRATHDRAAMTRNDLQNLLTHIEVSEM